MEVLLSITKFNIPFGQSIYEVRFAELRTTGGKESQSLSLDYGHVKQNSY
jgi:hypothetical protein